jgi:hypothetical protein
MVIFILVGRVVPSHKNIYVELVTTTSLSTESSTERLPLPARSIVLYIFNPPLAH